jgi:uncharacterized protein YndB with AHSA1/START domain
MATEGTFVLADIGGYTKFLTGVGIEHGKEITEDLLNHLLKCNHGRWKLANVEGDCIFFCREGREPPDELLSHIGELYKQFSARTIDIAARAACPCGACTRTGDLSLKFIVHAGQFDVQNIGGRQELVGPEVIVAHRLLKNSVPLDEYALLTAAYLQGASLATTLPIAQSTERYDDVGEIACTYVDLSPLRDEIRTTNWFFLTPEQARLMIEIDIAAPPSRVWQALTNGEEFAHWNNLREFTELPPVKAAAGGGHRCVLPNGQVTVQVTTAIDEENHRLTTKWWGSRLLKDAYVTEEALPGPDGGTHFRFLMTFRPGIPVISTLMTPIMKRMSTKMLTETFARLKDFCEAGTPVTAPPADTVRG